MSFETYGQVKDKIHCEERGRIRVKGIAYPVATFVAVAPREDTDVIGEAVHAELPHFRLDVETVSMSTEERRQAAAALRNALEMLGNQKED